jgi:hypothetical protein
MGWTAIGAYILDQVWGYQGANKHRENMIALASRKAIYDLGGSRITALPQVASAQDAVEYRDIELDGTNLGGFTVRLRVECRTINAATSVTPKLRNVTDSTDAGTGVACSATNADYSGTNQKQTITVTLAAGVKKYRLMGTPSNTTHPTFIIGDLEIFATA